MTDIEDHRDLLEGKAFANVSTFMPDGPPHVVPVWVGYDGEYVLTAGDVNHRRHRNLQRDPRVALSVSTPEDPYRALLIRGEAVELAEEGALAFLDRKARLHWEVSEYPFERDKDRFLVKIRPDEVVDASSHVPAEYDGE